MSLRRPKAITTDYRPPGAGTPSPLERSPSGTRPGAAACPHRRDPWEILDRNNKARDREHDKAVATLSVDAALGAWKSLKGQKVGKPFTPAEWWVARRYAALCRRLVNLQPHNA